MAGRGRRFREVGFNKPKPLIQILGRPMIDWALDSIKGLTIPHKIIFLALKQDLINGLYSVLNGRGLIIEVPKLTEGAVSTTLLADNYINNNEPILILNCDQYLEWNVNNFVKFSSTCDGAITVFESKNSHHSFVKYNDSKIIKIEEKKVISELAVGGLYYFKHGNKYLEAANSIITKNIRCNGEFYISPVFDELIRMNFDLRYFKLRNDQIHMLGTPEEVDSFISSKTERKLCQKS